jgi:hypothetical protein
MTASAPRLDRRLVATIAELDSPHEPIAETNRRVGHVAAALGLPKPSYEQVRTIVHASRNGVRYYDLLDAYGDLTFQEAPTREVVRRLLERERLPKRK